MAKLIVILGAALVAAGGTTYGLYEYTDVFGSKPDLGECPVAKGRCCGGPSECTPPADDAAMTAAVAVAGPAGLFTSTDKAKAAKKACCCEDDSSGLAAVVGAAAAARK